MRQRQINQTAGQADQIIDYTAAESPSPRRRPKAPSSANQQMRWSPRGAHRMLKVRTAAMNGTLASDYTVTEP